MARKTLLRVFIFAAVCGILFLCGAKIAAQTKNPTRETIVYTPTHGVYYTHKAPQKQAQPVVLFFDEYRKFAYRQELEDAAAMYGVSTTTMWRIIVCESNAVWTAKNKTSTAYGLLQFLDSTWSITPYAGEERSDPVAQLAAGAWLLARDGAIHWRASVGCHGVL